MNDHASRTDARNLSDAHTARPELAGRKAIITGGTTGIGRAIAVLLASEGVDVFICGRDEDHLADALARIGEVGTGDGVACDLAEREGLDRFFEASAARAGSYDIAIFCAAVPAEGLTDMDEDAIRYALADNFTGLVIGAHKAVAQIRKQGTGSGDLVFIGSYSTHKLGGGSTIYAATKTGVAGFAEALRREIAQDGIKVSLITPALTGSDFQPDMDEEEKRGKIRDEAMMRAEDVAVAVHYALTQPRRTVIQEVVLAQRNTDA